MFLLVSRTERFSDFCGMTDIGINWMITEYEDIKNHSYMLIFLCV